MKMRIRILLVEDEPAILRGIRASIERISEEFEMIATAYNGKDALIEIQKHQPDLVITDIRMPVMDGLPMIEEAKKNGCAADFMILTGYAEFEYARTAMKLGVNEYLLKPIDPDDLNKVMYEAKKRIETQIYERQALYLKQQLKKQAYMTTSDSNPLQNYHTILLFAYIGPITTHLYGELNEAAELAQHQDYTYLSGLSHTYQVNLYQFPGNYANETIFAITYPSSYHCPRQTVLQLAEEIRNHTKRSPYSMNLVITEPIEDSRKLPATMQNCYLDTLFHIPFGTEQIWQVSPNSTTTAGTAVIQPSQGLESCLSVLHRTTTEELLTHMVKNVRSIWETSSLTQFQLQTDIRCLLQYAMKKRPDYQGITPDPAELLLNAPTLTDVSHNLLTELKQIYQIDSYAGKNNARDLIQDVKEYLENHFTETITCKTFSDLFGYHEKYITNLFKAEFGRSPSKYMTDLRLALAKQLMRQNPEVLLKDVAETIGYSDALYFSRVFKNSEGISPSAFLTELKKSNSAILS